MQLRRASYKWPARNQALAKARLARGLYACCLCGPLLQYKRGQVCLDHIEPVVPITGWDTLDGYAKRMFCHVDGFQVLCEAHHDAKTKEENVARKAFKEISDDAKRPSPNEALFKTKTKKKSKKSLTNEE